MGRATRDEIDAGVTQSIKSFAPNLDPQVKQRTYKHIHPSCADDECLGLSVYALGGHHSSVVSSAPTILRPRVRTPSTPSTLFSICIAIEIDIGVRKGRK